jgi:hypothetical protein
LQAQLIFVTDVVDFGVDSGPIDIVILPVILMSFEDFGLRLRRKYVLSFVCGEHCEPFGSSEGGSLGFDGSREINDRVSFRGSGGCVIFKFLGWG